MIGDMTTTVSTIKRRFDMLQNSGKAQAMGLTVWHVMSGGKEDDDPEPTGWDVWEFVTRRAGHVSYEVFKTAMRELMEYGVIERTGEFIIDKSQRGSARRPTLARSRWRITAIGREWWDSGGRDQFLFYITGDPDDKPPEKANAGMPEKAIPMLKVLAARGKPVAFKGGPPVWQAWRWLRSNGYTRSLAEITPEGRAFLEEFNGE